MTPDMPASDSSPWMGELRLDPQIHGKSRVPGPKEAGFNLRDFSQAVEERDIDYQASRYAPEAEMLVVDPDNPPSAPQELHGREAIRAWLSQADTTRVGLLVTDLVDGGDRVAFTERWHQQDGATVVATTTAEIDDELITMRHTVLVSDPDSG